MKKTSLPRRLQLEKSTVAVLTKSQMEQAAGAAPDPFPPSWFRCGFTLFCND
jgi:hypothetical protein